MAIQESGEMYLETIYVLTKNGHSVRSVDVAENMGFSKPSVSRAVNLLKRDGYINVDKEGCITLTKKGHDHANMIYERHVVLSKVLMLLGVSEKNATEDACRIEHIISEESFAAIKRQLYEYIKNNNHTHTPGEEN